MRLHAFAVLAVLPGAFALSVAMVLPAGCATAASSDPDAGDYGPVTFDGGGGPESFDSGFFDAGPIAPRPTFPPTTTASVRPPPISGGTLLVTSDGVNAIAADPDRDAVYGVSLTQAKVTFTLALQPGDEPGRIAEDGSHRVHVALRGGGALVTLDETTGQVIARRNVCPAPRGVAWDPATDLVWVACATGELVALPSAGGAATQSFTVERGLRDVIIQNGMMRVTKLREAQVLRMTASGGVEQRDTLPPQAGMLSHVAWRAVAGPSGELVASYQNEITTDVQTQQPGAYGGGGCGSSLPAAPAITSEPLPITDGGEGGAPPGPVFQQDAGCPGPVVTSLLGVMDANGNLVAQTVMPGVLPVDVAVSRDGKWIAAVFPGSAYAGSLPTAATFDATQPSLPLLGESTFTPQGFSLQPIAVTFDGAGDVLIQTREPAGLWISSASGVFAQVQLASTSRADTGLDVFHSQAGADIACASCHPEGGDDGHVWMLNGDQRRTPSLRGTIAGTAPYHWPGDEANLDALLADVYQVRMLGAPLDPGQTTAIESWVEAIPAPPAPSWIDAASAQRGKALFSNGVTRCNTCHSGAKFTDNLTVDVGTGGAFQVPPLVGVGWRTPLMHDGCASTVADRFGTCATPQHGTIGQLSAQDLSDLEMYLQSL
jgi:mono/diheme cytochrome c family protein